MYKNGFTIFKKRKMTILTSDYHDIFVSLYLFQYEDLLLIAINGDGLESEEMLHRKVSVFVRLMEFLYGPVSEE